MDMSEDVVARELVGDVWPVTHPGEDPVLINAVSIQRQLLHSSSMVLLKK